MKKYIFLSLSGLFALNVFSEVYGMNNPPPVEERRPPSIKAERKEAVKKRSAKASAEFWERVNNNPEFQRLRAPLFPG